MLSDLALHIVDIVQNSIAANARHIEISVSVSECADADSLVITVKDDGCGMTPEQLSRVRDPFMTSRKTRRVGFGVPFLAQACEQSGGAFWIESQEGAGTTVRASFVRGHIDCPPMGPIVDTVCLLFLMHGDVSFIYRQSFNKKEFSIDTEEMKKSLQCGRLEVAKHGKWLKTAVSEGIASLRENGVAPCKH